MLNNNKAQTVDNRDSDVNSGSGDNAFVTSKCPKCFGTCYMSRMEFLCEDCLGDFIVPIQAMKNLKGAYELDPKYIVEHYYGNKSPIDETSSAENASNYMLNISGIILEHVKHLNAKYKFGTLADAMKIFLATMFEFSSLLENAKTTYVGLINEEGLKSYNLMGGGIFTKTKDLIAKDKLNSAETSDFITNISREMYLKDIKSMYEQLATDKPTNMGSNNDLIES